MTTSTFQVANRPTARRLCAAIKSRGFEVTDSTRLGGAAVTVHNHPESDLATIDRLVRATDPTARLLTRQD